MKRFIVLILGFIAILTIIGCTAGRLTEDEYVKNANEAFRQGNLNEAWSNYKMVISYYPESSKIDQYRQQLADVLVKMSQESSEPLKMAYIDELKMLGASTDTLLAWLNFQSSLKEKDHAKAIAAAKTITYTDYLLAAQYAVNRMRFSDALSAYTKALEIYPQNQQAYKAAFLAGFVCSEYLKDKEKARNYYTVVIEKYPDCDLADDAKWMLDNLDKSPDELMFNTDSTEA